MQEFLTNNTVNCNLMSLTGYRTLVILDLLMESPKSVDEINDYFFNHQYIKEKFSNDTIRIYINSLRAAGFEITRANKSNGNKYELISHPFDFEIPLSQVKSLIKLHKNFYDKIEIEQVLDCRKLFAKIYHLIKDEKVKNMLLHSSPFVTTIDEGVLNELIKLCKLKSNSQIMMLYKSPRSGEKRIEIIPDKLSFKSEKLYLWGYCLTYGEYSYFRVDRILKILARNLKPSEGDFPKVNVVYELYSETKNSYIPDENKVVLERNKDKMVVNHTFWNNFEVVQELLYMGPDCKVLYPEHLKAELLEHLQKMEEVYHE